MNKKRLRNLIFIIISIFFTIILISFWKLENESQSILNIKRHKGHLLCVLIPYRDRFDELEQMVPHTIQFLSKQNVKNYIIVLNQTDEYRFNRASLINVGWLEADRLGCDYMCMHDVDILPLNPELNYQYPGKGIVRHISSGNYHPIKRYDYNKFIGGVLLMRMEDFYKVNGMSNKYWGWGLEDDEFYLRLKDFNLTAKIERPQNLTTNRTNTFKHIHSKNHKRDYALIGNQKKLTRQRDRISGLNSVRYTIISRSILKIKTFNCSVINLKLFCDKLWTPYCDLSFKNNLKPK